MAGPHSSYSCLEIHICWNDESDARIDPPIHTEYFLSTGAITLVFMVEGTILSNSFFILSAIPGNIKEKYTYKMIYRISCIYNQLYQSTLILTELLQHNLINVSYLTACYLYQVMMTLHFLNDVANDAESTQKRKITS